MKLSAAVFGRRGCGEAAASSRKNGARLPAGSGIQHSFEGHGTRARSPEPVERILEVRGCAVLRALDVIWKHRSPACEASDPVLEADGVLAGLHVEQFLRKVCIPGFSAC